MFRGAAEDQVLLLPRTRMLPPSAPAPWASTRWQVPVAVLISDSFGRAWRNGVVNVAIGAAGLPSIIDRRGEYDREGRALEMTGGRLGRRHRCRRRVGHG